MKVDIIEGSYVRDRATYYCVFNQVGRRRLGLYEIRLKKFVKLMRINPLKKRFY